MTVRDLVRKIVCCDDVYKSVMINGRDVVLTDSNLNLKVLDFRVVCSDTRTKIHIETK